MFLEKPAFPVAFLQKDAEEKVSSLIVSRHWREGDYSISSAELVYVPHWFYSYDISEEKDGKTDSLESGYGALNAFSGKPEESIAELHLDTNVSLEQEPSHEFAFKVLAPKLSEDEAKAKLQRLLSHGRKAAKKSVDVYSIELLFVPFWIVRAKVSSSEVGVVVSAVEGTTLNAVALPTREKGFSELTAEALQELSDPVQWLNYSAELVSGFSRGVAGATKTGSASGEGIDLSDSGTQVIILAIIAILVIIWVAYL